MASVLSSANIYFCFFVPSGYFDSGSELNPALHLWSLGVEEQFYLVWPFVMMGLTRLPTKWALGLIFGIVTISTILGQLLFASYPSISYYMLFTRASELAIGALLVFLDLSVFENNYWLAEGSGLLGIFFIVCSSFLFTPKIVFPGFYSLIPCTGCALVIASGFHVRTWVAAILSQRPLLFWAHFLFCLFVSLAYTRFFALVECRSDRYPRFVSDTLYARRITFVIHCDRKTIAYY
jgi:peptidoglycan/LPS O-acetylase OafA/YrhL